MAMNRTNSMPAVAPEPSSQVSITALPVVVLNRVRNALHGIGASVLYYLHRAVYLVALGITVFHQSLRPVNWRRTTGRELIRQVYYTAATALPAVVLVAILVGLGLVFQLLYWLNMAGQAGLVGQFLALVLAREIAPVLIALIVLGRSGTAVIAELATMEVTGQVRLLESQGIDPLHLLVMPRALAMPLCTLMLTVIFLSVALVTGLLADQLLSVSSVPPYELANNVLGAIHVGDYVVIVVKPLLCGYAVGLICSVTGLAVTQAITEVPRALPRGFMECFIAILFLSGAVSLVA
jgi:phospholipid/cholesterol/gamma-HCH transport system permease protein